MVLTPISCRVWICIPQRVFKCRKKGPYIWRLFPPSFFPRPFLPRVAWAKGDMLAVGEPVPTKNIVLKNILASQNRANDHILSECVSWLVWGHYAVYSVVYLVVYLQAWRWWPVHYRTTFFWGFFCPCSSPPSVYNRTYRAVLKAVVLDPRGCALICTLAQFCGFLSRVPWPVRRLDPKRSLGGLICLCRCVKMSIVSFPAPLCGQIVVSNTTPHTYVISKEIPHGYQRVLHDLPPHKGRGRGKGSSLRQSQWLFSCGTWIYPGFFRYSAKKKSFLVWKHTYILGRPINIKNWGKTM